MHSTSTRTSICSNRAELHTRRRQLNMFNGRYIIKYCTDIWASRARSRCTRNHIQSIHSLCNAGGLCKFHSVIALFGLIRIHNDDLPQNKSTAITSTRSTAYLVILIWRWPIRRSSQNTNRIFHTAPARAPSWVNDNVNKLRTRQTDRPVEWAREFIRFLCVRVRCPNTE